MRTKRRPPQAERDDARVAWIQFQCRQKLQDRRNIKKRVRDLNRRINLENVVVVGIAAGEAAAAVVVVVAAAAAVEEE